MTTMQKTSMASTIINARMPYPEPDLSSLLFTIECSSNITKVVPQNSQQIASAGEIDAQGGLLLPSLCHSHIHLDKCFILDRCELVTGDFSEAMRVTAAAKSNFRNNKDDLLDRGRRLIRESLQYGVTSMRAHVEVDSLVGQTCLDMACDLKDEFRDSCYIQIAVFAQEPLFCDAEDSEPGENYQFLVEAMSRPEVEALGSAPYTEPIVAQAKKNIALIFDLASRHNHHIDFHLDYNLDPNSEPLIYTVIQHAKGLSNSFLQQRRITIGHATRLQLFSDSEWHSLSRLIGNRIPLSIVGLPNSDLYMQGRNKAHEPLGAPRGTLRVTQISKSYGIDVAMSVNNVENAFTPQGSPDPLALCTLGTAIFQAATLEDIRILLRAVTLTSKMAIGDRCAKDLVVSDGDPADFVILHGIGTLHQAVLNPPHTRTTIRDGKKYEP
ncbi:hypothetical protein C8J56DRAFT_910446, partial [Mycena floridula]